MHAYSSMCFRTWDIQSSLIPIKDCRHLPNEATSKHRLDEVSFVFLCSWDIFVFCSNQQWRIMPLRVTITELLLKEVIAPLGRWMAGMLLCGKYPIHIEGNTGKALSFDKPCNECSDTCAESQGKPQHSGIILRGLCFGGVLSHFQSAVKSRVLHFV